MGNGEAVYFKRDVYPLRRGLKFLGRPARAAVEVFAYRRLRELDIPAPEVLASGERRVLGLLQACFIVTREVPETMDLRRFAASVWTRMTGPERKRVYEEIAGALLAQVRTAHDAGFFHHDLKWRNVLIRRTPQGYEPIWIDAPRAAHRRFTRRRGIIVDLSGLARLAVSATSVYDRMRFVCRYLGPARAPGEASALYRAVSRHLRRRPPRTLLPEQGKRQPEPSARWLMSGVEYEALVNGAAVVKRHRTGVKVWQLPDERIVKIFRPKGWFSRERIYPRSIKFARNAARLRRLGLQSVDVQRVFYCPSIRRHGVLYRFLPGQTLDVALAASDDCARMRELAALMARLHDERIFFRSLHPGNVVLMPDGSMGLIDVQEMHFRRRRLSRSARVRNFRHLLRNRAHHPLFRRFGMARFVDAYLDASTSLSGAAKTALRAQLHGLEVMLEAADADGRPAAAG